MTSQALDNLCKTGSLKPEPVNQREVNGLLRSASVRLADALNPALAIESRFDLAYNASHALALAALRLQGYRSENRYLVFQCLQHTLGLQPAIWRIFAKAHQQRNLAEYEGFIEVDPQLLDELISSAQLLQTKLTAD